MTRGPAQRSVNLVLVTILCLASLTALIQTAAHAVEMTVSGAEAAIEDVPLPPMLGPEPFAGLELSAPLLVEEVDVGTTSVISVSITEEGFAPEVVTVTIDSWGGPPSGGM